MARHVALFRGINVGGHNKIAMAELRDSFESLGYAHVSSVIQSGNVCFDTDDEPESVALRIRDAVATRFSIDVPIVLRTHTQMLATLDAHPFDVGDIEPKLHHIMFLADAAPDDAVELIGDHSPGAEYAAIGREIHVRYPAGSARSKLTVDLVDRRLCTTATARNLLTCQKFAAELSLEG